MQNELRTRRNTTLIYVDGHELRKKSTRLNRSRYVCTDKWKTRCKFHIFIENGVMDRHGEHIHPADHGQANCEFFKDKLWEQVTTTEDELRAIWERLAIDFPEASIKITYPSIARQMKRWRQEFRPPVPRTLTHFMELINSQQWSKYRQYNDGQLLSIHTIVLNNDGDRVTIIWDPQFVSSLQDVIELYIDATYEICPRQMKIYQFLSILGNIDNTAIPLAWAFMTRKTGTAYRAVLNFFHNTVAPHIQPEIVHIDFENAIRNEFALIYPNVIIVLCFFHHCQALWKKIKVKGKAFIEKLASWDVALAFYRKLMGLALLPADNVYDSFNNLIQHTSPDVLEFFGHSFIFDYYERYWLGQITPERFSVYGHRNRTTNFIESYHRGMRVRMGSHPGIWQFMDKLKKYHAVVKIETSSLNNGYSIRQPTLRKYINRERVLTRMWDLHDEGLMSATRFLSCYNHVSESFDNDYILTEPAQVDEFLTLPVHDTNVQVPREDGIINIEGLDGVIAILRRNPEEQNFIVLILENINSSLCPACQRSILDVITLPCQHWFLCQTCTFSRIQEAIQNNMALLCQHCGQQCQQFQTIQIS